MSNLTEKAAYLKGLMQGLDIDQATKEGKLFAAMVELMDEMSATIADLEDNQETLTDLVDALNEDVDGLTEEVYGYDDFDEDDEDYEDDDAVYEITCDGCGETFYLDEDEVAQGSYVCPACGKTLEFEFEDDCDCGCHHHHEDEADEDGDIAF